MYAKYDDTVKMFGFYSDPIDGGIELTDDQYQGLLDQQSTPGVAMQIVPDAQGFPVCVTFDSILTEDQKASGILAANTAERSALMSVANNATLGMSDAFVAGLLDDGDTVIFKAWAKYKLALSKVDLTQATPSWPIAP